MDDTRRTYIAIAGPPAAGKTALTRLLARAYGLTPWTSPGADPYEGDCRLAPARWAMECEAARLARLLAQTRAIAQSPAPAAQDGTPWEVAGARLPYLRAMGLLDEDEADTLLRLARLGAEGLPTPTLTIYLRRRPASLAERIQRRGRPGESGVTIGQLRDLADIYDTWARAFPAPLMALDADDCPYETDPRALRRVCRSVDTILFGLF